MQALAPLLIIETAVPMSDGEKKKWFKERQSEGTQKGATWHRFCHHPTNRNRLLYEGWIEQPDDKGAKPQPRWSED